MLEAAGSRAENDRLIVGWISAGEARAPVSPTAEGRRINLAFRLL
jgi:hypothetical protein